jgi:hypothetical protein
MLDTMEQLARVPTRHRGKVAAAAALAGTVAVAQWLDRTSGSTRAERPRRLPGDELDNRPSATRLVPELQRPLRAGDHIPDGPPGTAWFVVERVDPPRLLVLHSTTHLPHAWRERLGAAIDWTWTFTLAGAGDGGTRLQLRVRGRTRPWWLTTAYVAALVPADHLMAGSMLTGIRRRAAAAVT